MRRLGRKFLEKGAENGTFLITDEHGWTRVFQQEKTERTKAFTLIARINTNFYPQMGPDGRRFLTAPAFIGFRRGRAEVTQPLSGLRVLRVITQGSPASA